MLARQLNDLGNSWINMFKEWATMPCRPWWQSIPLVGTLARQVPMGAAVLEDLEEQGSTGDT
ncbi:hypothetical protein [Streptomyces sp. NPDC048419]|uniref:hypothetical protein n=1 Tax=Streptomyces sp. NPDC048419 TaxID=3365547 RepID=UPI00371BBD58